MSEPATVTSAYAPDVDDVRQWMEKMIKSLRFVDLVVAVIAFITRVSVRSGAVDGGGGCGPDLAFS